MSSGRHRRAPEHRLAHPWLGAGAITLGIGAALASGSGVAHADATDGPAASSSTSAGSDGAAHDSAAAHDPAPAKRQRPPGAGHRTSSTKARGNGATPTSTSPGTPDGSTPTATDAPASAHHGALTHPALTRSPKSGDAAAVRSAPAVETAAAPRIALAAAAVTPTPGVLPVGAAPAAPALPRNPVVGVLTEVAAVVNTLIAPNPAVRPSNPLQLLAFEVVRRIEIGLRLPVIGTPITVNRDPVIGQNPVSSAISPPRADDVVETPYGEIGKWLLAPNGVISTYGGQTFAGKTIVEPINVIILDSTSTSTAAAAAKLGAAMSGAGFPAQAIHSTGFLGVIGDDTYAQQPTGFLQAFSDANFLLPDDHARVFGPAPAQSEAGYVWTVAASRELFGLNGLIPAHTYVSYDQARDELASRLVDTGATLVGIVPLQNAYDGPTSTAGDQDGYAIVIRLGS